MLYRNRYLIALYSKKDDLPVGVYDNVEELCDALKCSPSTIRSALSRHQQYFYLIDVFKIEDDAFVETDYSLLAMYQSGALTSRPAGVVADNCGCSRRTIFRKKEVLKNEKL